MISTIDVFFDSVVAIDQVGLEFILNQHRSKYFWEEYEPGKFKRNNIVLNNQSKTKIKIWSKSNAFIANSSLNMNYKTKYITIGKGYPL